MSDGTAFTYLVNGISPLEGDALDGGIELPLYARPGTQLKIPVTKLHPHPDNLREDVGDVEAEAASMRAHGVLQALVVVPHTVKAGHYYVIAGHRRLAAAKLAELASVPCMVRQVDIGLAKAIQVMLIENWQRKDLNPMEKARGLGRLRDEEGLSSVQIAKQIGISTPTVATYLALLELSRSTQQRVADGRLSAAEAVAAVRRTRAQTARRNGGKDRRESMAASWEPDWWTWQHPQARAAAAMCDARDHNMRRRVGKVACGQCWETVIRRDERLVAATPTRLTVVGDL